MSSSTSTTPAAATTATPPLELFFRGPNELRFGQLSKDGISLDISQTLAEKLKRICFSPSNPELTLKLFADGDLVLLKNQESIPISSQTQQCEFSPSGRYFQTWSKPDTLALFAVEDVSTPLFTVKSKTVTNLFHFPNHEQFAVLVSGAEVQVYDLQVKTLGFKAVVQGMTQFSLCPQSDLLLFAAFIPAKGSKPASCALFNDKGESIATCQTFRAEECEFRWSPFFPGDVLCKMETGLDVTGKSYYGESKLAKMSLSLRNAILLPDSGVSDFAWSPRKHVFALVNLQGCTLYDGKTCAEVFSFKTTHKNVVRFSPSGRFLVLAGFGNLPGKMEFWDVKRLKKLGQGQAQMAVTFEWSPCGRFFLTHTLKPRMNVDNGITVFSYRGVEIARYFAQDDGLLGNGGLVECAFLPPKGEFPDLPASPVVGPSKEMEEELKMEKMSFTQFKLEEKKRAAAALLVPTLPPPVIPPPPEAAAQTVVEEEDEDVEKALKKLKKYLKQIEDIENAGGPKGNEQVQKVRRKKETLRKIRELEEKLKQ